MFRFFEVRPRDHEFLAAGIQPPLKHVIKIVLVPLSPVVFASEYRVPKIDADLSCIRPVH
jgi:hypothetical protein